MIGTIRLLAASDVDRLLPLEDCALAVAEAFRGHALGRAPEPVVAGIHVAGGGFHIKAAVLVGERSYFAAKVNANFPANPRSGLPTIQGLVLLCDATDGCPLALLDSAVITARRTAAATLLAARLLARADATVATIVGCGVQGQEQLRALALARSLTRAYAFDLATSRAQAFAGAMAAELRIPVEAGADLRRALRESLLCVTCTSATRPLLHPGDLAPGTFVAAVGADNGEKNEIAPALLGACRVVPDLRAQAVHIGDLHHALEAGTMSLNEVHAELPEILAGQKPGRTGPEEIFVFDSTGTALQDVAAAVLVFQRAQRAGVGATFRVDA